MIKMLQYKMYPAGELHCPTTALVIYMLLISVISIINVCMYVCFILSKPAHINLNYTRNKSVLEAYEKTKALPYTAVQYMIMFSHLHNLGGLQYLP